MQIRNSRFRNLTLLSFGVFVLVVAYAQTQTTAPPLPIFGPVVQDGRQVATADMTATNPPIPGDVIRNSTLTHADLATYAWLEFVALVSPAGSPRGTPGGSFMMSGSNQTSTLVWETYQHRSELFPCSPGGSSATGLAAPQPWNNKPTYVYQTAYSPKVTCATSPYSNYNNVDEATQIGQNFLFFPNSPGQNPPYQPRLEGAAGATGPTGDAQVLFEAKVNQYEWDYVNRNWTIWGGTGSTGAVPPSPSNPISLPDGTVEVKAAWRPLSSIPAAQQYRYHIATVITYSGQDSNPTIKTEQYALIALHIIHKSPNFPAFTFATFEQVDDFQNQATSSPSGVYYVPVYSQIGYTLTANGPSIYENGQPFSTTAPVAAPLGPTGALAINLPIGAVTGIAGTTGIAVYGVTGATGLTGVTNPVTSSPYVGVPVTQPVPLAASVAAVNAQALQAMQGMSGFNSKFVWQYYRLAGVQGLPANNESTDDFYLANIVVESSQPGIQLFRGIPGNFPTVTLTNTRNFANVAQSSPFNLPGGPTGPTGPTGPATPAISGGGCQGCHGVATVNFGTSFSFLIAEGSGGGGFNVEAKGVIPPSGTTGVSGTNALARRVNARYRYTKK